MGARVSRTVSSQVLPASKKHLRCLRLLQGPFAPRLPCVLSVFSTSTSTQPAPPFRLSSTPSCGFVHNSHCRRASFSLRHAAPSSVLQSSYASCTGATKQSCCPHSHRLLPQSVEAKRNVLRRAFARTLASDPLRMAALSSKPLLQAFVGCAVSPLRLLSPLSASGHCSLAFPLLRSPHASAAHRCLSPLLAVPLVSALVRSVPASLLLLRVAFPEACRPASATSAATRARHSILLRVCPFSVFLSCLSPQPTSASAFHDAVMRRLRSRPVSLANCIFGPSFSVRRCFIRSTSLTRAAVRVRSEPVPAKDPLRSFAHPRWPLLCGLSRAHSFRVL
ncbi:hypothetical protein, conserved in T. vivax [Trypanosoma vivax Y486]|uniref:Uncharacterized protein n=1 Tax=Trypanosoma vivax (strain Y486) TaxID=1055687 RepID=F9WNU0_TRYVY|nr:hypothetical protein, conserved in T. vivax [Trypanosoma vivax Y486]|eukprot:CCD19211.1 hypothetical protein, conserved in T. vivax [Trypanosoma vivax Y486]